MVNVTLSTCNKKMGVVLLAAGLVLILVGWAIVEGRSAQSDTRDVQTEIRAHTAAQEVREKHVVDTLNDIKVAVKEIDGKLDRALRERHVGGGE